MATYELTLTEESVESMTQEEISEVDILIEDLQCPKCLNKGAEWIYEERQHEDILDIIGIRCCNCKNPVTNGD